MTGLHAASNLTWLPGATRKPLSGQPGFPWQVDCPTKLTLHTTETGNVVPSYTPGFKAPHLTVLVRPGAGVDPVQHIPFDRAAYSLVHANGTVATNGAHAIQIELCGTSALGGPGYYWPNADTKVLTDLWVKVIKPISDAFGIQLKSPTWKPYPASYGSPRSLLRLEGDEPSPLATPVAPWERTEDDPDVPEGAVPRLGTLGASGNGIRFTEAAWLAWDGVNGHEHVPGGNVHGDPGLFPFAKLAAIANNAPLTVDGTLGEQTIARWQTYLNNQGAKPQLAVDGALGPATWYAVDVWLGVTPPNGVAGRDTVRALERRLGVTADGTLGRDVVRALQRFLNAQAAKS